MHERLRRLGHAIATEGDLPPWLVPIRHPARWLWVLYRSLVRDRAFEHAAAMAYATLVALVPLLLLITAVLEVTGIVEQDESALRALLFRGVLGDLPEVEAFIVPGLAGVDFRTLGLVGILGLGLTTWRLYVLIEQAYAAIFGVEVKRTFQQRVLLFYVGLTLLPVLFVDAFLQAWRVTASIGLSGAVALIAQALVLLAALRYFPNTRVRWGPAIAGTITSLGLLQATHAVFRLYLKVFSGADPVRVIYGSLAALPVFLIWLWLLWLMVLVGVEVAAVAQNYRTMAAEALDLADQVSPRAGPGVDVALLLLAVVADRFHRGEGAADTAWIAERTGLSEKHALPVLEALECCGLLSSKTDTWLLVRPPEHVRLTEVVGAWRTQASSSGADTEALQRVRADVDAALPDTLADGVSRWLGQASEA